MARKCDPKQPLPDADEEAYCQQRADGFDIIEAARNLGWNVASGRASKCEARPRVQARIAWLRRQDLTDEMLRTRRAEIRRRLELSAKFNLLDFIKTDSIGKMPEGKVEIDWQRLKESEYGLAVASLRFDRERGALIEFRRDDRLQAEAQLRDMFGFSAPKRLEATGKDGAPLFDLSKLTDEQLFALRGILAIARPAAIAASG